MNSPASNDPETVPADAEPISATDAAHSTHATHTGHPDPITGEPDAHPVGVGIGALSAGAAGAAIGAFAGPVGMVIGAAIGAIAGGLAGKEVAESPETTPVETEGTALDEFDHGQGGTSTEEIPLSSSLEERTSPPDDAFFTSGTVSGADPERTDAALDDFDRPRVAAVPVTHGAADDDAPLPTASSGLITPDESSFFADSTTGESSVLTESPLPAATAVTAKPDVPATVSSQLSNDEPPYNENLIRTGAYYRFLNRQTIGQSGDELGDWLAAENEVMPG